MKQVKWFSFTNEGDSGFKDLNIFLAEKKQLEELLELKNRTIKCFDDKLSQTEKQLEQLGEKE